MTVTTYTGTVAWTSKPKIEGGWDGRKYLERYYFLGLDVDGQELKFKVTTRREYEGPGLPVDFNPQDCPDKLPKPWQGDTVEVSTRSRATTAWKSVRHYRDGEDLTITTEGGARDEWKAQKDDERAEQDKAEAEERAANEAREQERQDFWDGLVEEHIPQDVKDLETKTLNHETIHKFLGDCLGDGMEYGTRARSGHGGTPGSGLCRASSYLGPTGPFYFKPDSWVSGYIRIMADNDLVLYDETTRHYKTTPKGEEMYGRLDAAIETIDGAKETRRAEEQEAKWAAERTAEERRRLLSLAEVSMEEYIDEGNEEDVEHALRVLTKRLGMTEEEAEAQLTEWRELFTESS